MVSKTAEFISVTAMLSVGVPIAGTFVIREREVAPADKLCSFSPGLHSLALCLGVSDSEKQEIALFLILTHGTWQ